MEIDHIAVFLLDTKEKLFAAGERESKNYFLRIKGRPQICLMITG